MEAVKLALDAVGDLKVYKRQEANLSNFKFLVFTNVVILDGVGDHSIILARVHVLDEHITIGNHQDCPKYGHISTHS